MSIDGEDLTSVGKLFHNFGAHTENALSPKVVVLDLSTLRRYWLLERKFRWFLYSWINSLRYVGANPLKTLYVRSSNLNLIRLCVVSQWRSFNIGVIYSFILESIKKFLWVTKVLDNCHATASLFHKVFYSSVYRKVPLTIRRLQRLILHLVKTKHRRL